VKENKKNERIIVKIYFCFIYVTNIYRCTFGSCRILRSIVRNKYTDVISHRRQHRTKTDIAIQWSVIDHSISDVILLIRQQTSIDICRRIFAHSNLDLWSVRSGTHANNTIWWENFTLHLCHQLTFVVSKPPVDTKPGPKILS
jgi:hypothetical protein